MQIIPILATPNQEFQVVLDNQNCTINLRWQQRRLYLSLFIAQQPVITGAICQSWSTIVQIPDFAFRGALSFIDTDGDSSPHWSGLGTRWLLVYRPESELEGGIG